jgi:hypothetical protein
MSRRHRQPKIRHDPFIMMSVEIWKSPAWRAMSHGARNLYIALKHRYFPKDPNNGWIYLSQRDAAAEIGSSTEEITRWYRELQHYGFIVMTEAGKLGLDGYGKAPHWRLTELGYMKEPPTKDFNKWDGTRFRHRARASRKQNPV